MAQTNKTSDLCTDIITLLKDNLDTLGINSVLFGEQLMIPDPPTAVVIPGVKQVELIGVQGPGGRVRNYIPVLVDIHTTKVGDESTARMDITILSEAVEDLLNAEAALAKFGGHIIYGFVTSSDPGQSSYQNGEFRTVRLTFVGISETLLGR